MQHGSQFAADGTRQCQRGQRVGGVVPAVNPQGIHRHQTLDEHCVFIPVPGLAVWLQGQWRLEPLFPDGFIDLCGAHQPGHAIDGFHPVVARALRYTAAEGGVLAQLFAFDRERQAGHHGCVITVEQHQTLTPEYIEFGCAVSLHACMPVQMVLAQVQYRRDRRLKGIDLVKLKAGKLKHPDIGQRAGIKPLGQRVKQGRTNVAGHRHQCAGTFQQTPSQRGDCGFTVGAGDADDFGRISLRLLQVCQSLGKQAQLVAARQALSLRCRHHAADLCG